MFSYEVACILLGLGIAVDVSLATIAMYPRFKYMSDGYSWATKVTATHVAFPMIGYYGFVYLYRIAPQLDLLLGIVATLAVFWFLVTAFRELFEADEPDTGHHSMISWATVLAVSWDALWSGPAKSAQALGWSAWEVFFSFIIAGAIVGGVALLAIFLSVRLNARAVTSSQSLKTRARREVMAAWLEFSVIGYFGLLAFFRYVLGSNISWLAILAGSFFIWSGPFLLRAKTLQDARLAKY